MLASSITTRNLGVIFNQDNSFTSNRKYISRTGSFYLKNNAQIKNLLSQSDAVKLTQTSAAPRLDYCKN